MFCMIPKCFKKPSFLGSISCEICIILDVYCTYHHNPVLCISFNVQALFCFLKTNKYHCVSLRYLSCSHAVLYAPFAMLRAVLIVEALFAYFDVIFAFFANMNRANDLSDYSTRAHIVKLYFRKITSSNFKVFLEIPIHLRQNVIYDSE